MALEPRKRRMHYYSFSDEWPGTTTTTTTTAAAAAAATTTTTTTIYCYLVCYSDILCVHVLYILMLYSVSIIVIYLAP